MKSIPVAFSVDAYSRHVIKDRKIKNNYQNDLKTKKKSVMYIEIHSQYAVKILTEWRKEQSKILYNKKVDQSHCWRSWWARFGSEYIFLKSV